MAFVDGFEPGVGHRIASSCMMVFHQGEAGVLVLCEVAWVLHDVECRVVR